MLEFLKVLQQAWMNKIAMKCEAWMRHMVSRGFIVQIKSLVMGRSNLEALYDYAWLNERQLMTFIIAIVVFAGVFFLLAFPLTIKALFFAKRRFQPKRYWKKSVALFATPAALLILIAM